ncbi:MAG: retropepsin-like aspartic protease [Candidatus Hydrogenedentota bacterium]
MTVIQKQILFEGSKGKRKEIALFDSGATYSCIKRDLASQLGLLDKLPKPFRIETAEKGRKVKIKEHISLIFYINGYRFTDEFMVIENLSESVLIGAATLQKWRIKLDFENDDVIIDPRVTKLRLI